MTRILFLPVAILLALPALAGDPVTRDDLHEDDASNTRQQQRDRAVEREDLHDGARHDERKGDLTRETSRERVRYEDGRYIVTDDQGQGAKVEVTHDEEAVRTTANDRTRGAGDDLRKTAMDIVEGAARGIEDVEDQQKQPDVFREQD